VHHFVAAQNGIGGAGTDAQGTPDAPCLVNHGHGHWAFNTVLGVERQHWAFGDFGQDDNALKSTRGTLINGRIVLCNGLCIGLAIGKAASGALRLRQRIVDAFSQRDHFLGGTTFLATAFTDLLAVGLAPVFAVVFTTDSAAVLVDV
jgi:hypothetical protein